jgi:hypothetical protein
VYNIIKLNVVVSVTTKLRATGGHVVHPVIYNARELDINRLPGQNKQQPRTDNNLAAALALLDLLSPEGKSALSSWPSSSSRLGLHSRLDLTGHGKESLLNIGRSLGRCFEKFNSKTVCEFFTLFRGDDTFARQIGLVSHEQLVDILRGISINFMQPLLYIVERLLVRDIIDDDNSMSAAVIRRGDRTETFLSCCIPDLELDGLSIKFNGADFLK